MKKFTSVKDISDLDLLVKEAIAYGAKEIQLDYIRYNTAQGSSSQHAVNVHKIIQWYKEQVGKQNVALQIDVFGISSFGEETHIGDTKEDEDKRREKAQEADKKKRR